MNPPEKRLIKSKSGLRILPIKENKRSPFELSEPEWIKDCQSSSCTNCQSKFDFVKRKHHCRRCGRIFCNACCKSRTELPRMCFLDPVRMCGSCEKVTLEEESFYKQDLKILTTGALLQVNDHSADTKSAILHCCLSLDHCYLVLSGSESRSLPLVQITEVSTLINDENKNRLLNKVSFIVNGLNTVMDLQVPLTTSSYPSASGFLCSLQRAFRMTEEAKSVIGIGN